MLISQMTLVKKHQTAGWHLPTTYLIISYYLPSSTSDVSLHCFPVWNCTMITVDSSNTDFNPLPIQALLRSVFDESTITHGILHPCYKRDIAVSFL